MSSSHRSRASRGASTSTSQMRADDVHAFFEEKHIKEVGNDTATRELYRETRREIGFRESESVAYYGRDIESCDEVVMVST